MSDILHEAFQRLSLLEDDFDLSSDRNKIDELKSFIADDVPVPTEEIVDIEAYTPDELSDNYSGKVILECECCHCRIYKDEPEVIIDTEAQLANVDEECPCCDNTLGYTVIGKIEPFEKSREVKLDADEDEIEVEEDDLLKGEDELEDEDNFPADDIDVEESLDEGCNKKLKEENDPIFTCPKSGDKIVKASGDGYNIINDKGEEVGHLDAEDDDTAIEKYKKNKLFESVEINASGEDNIKVVKNDDGSMDINVNSTEPAAGEEIVPLDAEDEEDILNNESEEDEAEEPTEEAEGTSTEETPDIEEFGDEEMDGMGESFMRRVYSNVKGFNTTGVKSVGDSFIVEGLITYRSGKTRKTKFVFENMRFTKRNKLVMEGYNHTFAKAKKGFKIIGSYENKHYIPEQLQYNYNVKTLNESNQNELFRVSGRVKCSK